VSDGKSDRESYHHPICTQIGPRIGCENERVDGPLYCKRVTWRRRRRRWRQRPQRKPLIYNTLDRRTMGGRMDGRVYCVLPMQQQAQKPKDRSYKGKGTILKSDQRMLLYMPFPQYTLPDQRLELTDRLRVNGNCCCTSGGSVLFYYGDLFFTPY
jgi:hypothetical protein